jgi:hypothetical protein
MGQSSAFVDRPSSGKAPKTDTRSPAFGQVRTEMSLHVLAYNLKRMIAIIGVGPLLQAMRA